MKNSINLLFIILCTICNSQSPVLLVEYNFSDSFSNRKEVLIANQSKAFYQEINKKQIDSNTLSIDFEDGVYNVVDLSEYTFLNLLFLKAEEKASYNYLKTKNQELIIFDDMPALNWVILNESQNIAGYKCMKAEVNFRGRKFTAWFTSDINIPFGPFKFKGLPGLILELSSYYGSNDLIWRVNSIDTNYKLKIPVKEDFNGDNITLKDMIMKEASKRQNENDMFLSKLDRGIKQTGYSIERLGVERIYEWETTDEKK
jgi:GLPGLI family protein